MRYRRVTYRFTEVTGGLSQVYETEFWAALRPRAVASPFFRPPADVLETPAEYRVTVELPGVDEEEMDLYVHPDALVVTGRRACPCVEGARWHASEIRYGPFRFDMPLPADADPERVAASLERGVVHISIPRRSGGTNGGLV
jgi:HSP20 family protein